MIQYNVSVKDQNIVSLLWLFEQTAAAILKQAKAGDIPPRKREMYDAISAAVAPSREAVGEIVNAIDENIRKVFGVKAICDIADACTAVVTLLEERRPAHVVKLMAEIGVRDAIVTNWEKQGREIPKGEIR